MGSELKVAVHASNINSVSKKEPMNTTDLVLPLTNFSPLWPRVGGVYVAVIQLAECPHPASSASMP